jgi:hypothetical protein
MQNRTFGELFSLIKALCGIDGFATNEEIDVCNMINRRFSQIYNVTPMWERYLVISEPRDINAYNISNSSTSAVNQSYRFVGVANSANSSPALGQYGVVTGTSIYQGTVDKSIRIYKSTRTVEQTADGGGDTTTVVSELWVIDDNDTTTNGLVKDSNGEYTVTPVNPIIISDDTKTTTTVGGVTTITSGPTELEDIEDWNNGAEFLRVFKKNLIPFTEVGKSDIAEFIKIHRKKSMFNDSSIEYDFYVDSTGGNILNIISNDDSKAYVTYKIPLNLFIINTGGTKGITNRSTGLIEPFESSLEPVPSEFFNYLAHSSYADFLRMDGQQAKAMKEEELAEAFVVTELEKIDIIANNNNIRRKFSTYVNRQSR